MTGFPSGRGELNQRGMGGSMETTLMNRRGADLKQTNTQSISTAKRILLNESVLTKGG
jgi:hypothetical protein